MPAEVEFSATAENDQQDDEISVSHSNNAPNEATFKAGDEIVLVNLAKDVDRNGQQGVVVREFVDGEFLIKINKTEEKIKVQTRNLEHAETKIGGAEIVEHTPIAGSGTVEIDTEKEKLIRPGEGLQHLIAISLPETIYSSLIILPLCNNVGKTVYHRKLIRCALFFCLMANLAIQGFFLRYVYKIYSDNKDNPLVGECGSYKTDPNLRVFCTLVFTAYCFSEIAETFDMLTWIKKFPTSTKYEPLELREITGADGETEVKFSSGMTSWYKWYCYICILFPKFSIAVALLTYGTGFVVTTIYDSDLILNAIALGFVLDIDDMAYTYFMTYQMREIVQGLPPMIVKATKFNDFNTNYGTFIKAAILFGFTMATLTAYCPGEDDD